MKKIFIWIILLQIVFSKLANSQQKLPSHLTGDWISLQFKTALDDSLDFSISANISPQMLSFDSSGKCVVQTRFEQLFTMEKPIKIRNFEDGHIEVTYLVNNLRVYIITDDFEGRQFLFLRYEKTPTAILFVRYLAGK